MNNSKALKTYLIISGLLLSFIGGATLLMPVEMKASAGIDIASNISVINDVRAASAMILGVAILSLVGAFNPKLTFSATLSTILLFLSLGAGRVISILIDGMPVEGLLGATGLELVLGALGAVFFKVFQPSHK
ncbi:DUF4345 domain-containing protein [Pontibacter sp. G13]|uniref:DUF4345 domain-containing protein n=1 Tax=Pontibacter sp. G13 TaxID=3074898 RepID=UPI00288B8A76|nr:DUF4345 domain-containing protein [Pontibacter sp. G13]WNJ20508.1 DUF4345 domain-containing protein [Pontibacter sp. G13]